MQKRPKPSSSQHLTHSTEYGRHSRHCLGKVSTASTTLVGSIYPFLHCNGHEQLLRSSTIKFRLRARKRRSVSIFWQLSNRFTREVVVRRPKSALSEETPLSPPSLVRFSRLFKHSASQTTKVFARLSCLASNPLQPAQSCMCRSETRCFRASSRAGFQRRPAFLAPLSTSFLKNTLTLTAGIPLQARLRAQAFAVGVSNGNIAIPQKAHQ